MLYFREKSFLYSVALFFGLFLYFVLTRTGHWESYLDLEYQSEKPAFAKLSVKTPRGEMVKPFLLANLTSLASKQLHIIEVINKSQEQSEDKLYTSILEVNLAGRKQPLHPNATTRGAHRHLDYLLLHPGSKKRFSGVFGQGHLLFGLPRTSGPTEVRLNGKEFITFNIASPIAGIDFKLPVGKHLSTKTKQSIRLPVSELRNVKLDFDQKVSGLKITKASYRIENANHDSAPERYREKSVYPLDLEKIEQQGFIDIPPKLLEENQRRHIYLVAAALLLSLVVSIIFYEACQISKQGIMRWLTRENIAITSIISTVISIVLVGTWPAMMQTDSMATWVQVKYFDFNSWHSYTYTLFVMCLSLISETPLTISIFQGVLSVVLLSTFFCYLRRKGLSRRFVFPLMAISLIAPPIVLYPSFFVRDVLYCLLVVLLLVVFFILLCEKRLGNTIKIPMRFNVYLAVMVAFLALIRAEGIYLIVVLPILMYIFFERSKKVAISLFAISFILFFIGSGPLKSFFNVRDDMNYKLTLVMEPLGEIISQHYISDDYERDKRIINQVIAFNDLKKHYKHLEGFWSGRHLKYGRYTEFDVDNIVSLTKKLVVLNPDIYIKNRSRVFFDAITSKTGDVNLIPNTILDNASRWGWRQFQDDKFYLAIYDSYLTGEVFYKFQDKLEQIRKRSLVRDRSFITSPRTILWSVAVPLVISILVMSQWFLFPISAVCSFVVLCRVFMLYLFQPMSHFKYFYDLYLWGFLIIGTLALEWALWLRPRLRTLALSQQ